MRRTVVGLAALAIATLGLAPSAGAWNQAGSDVYRGSCHYYIWSNPTFNNARTQKLGGDCLGRLSVAMKKSNGTSGPRVYGSSTDAYVVGGSGNVGGFHWGCDACGIWVT